MLTLSSRMTAIQTPIIPIVAELIRQHPGTISLGQGVVSYPPPPAALAQLQQVFTDPQNHLYQNVQGILPLRQVIADKLAAENQIQVDSLDQIVVTAGSNMGFSHAVLAITQPGDEVILLRPYYFNHEMAIQMASCSPVIVDTDQDYQLQIDAIKAAITPKTRAVVTISPNNPSGVVYPVAALTEVNQLCRARGIYHISDEAYEYFTYDGIQHFSPGSLPESQSHTISLFSLSKAYGFASWRIGYMVIPPMLQPNLQKIQDTVLICPPVVSQYAALGALQTGANYCRGHMPQIVAARQQFLEKLAQVADFCQVPRAEGAFYFLLNLQTSLSAMTVVEQLIRDHGVAVIPGDTFGMTQGCYLRVAYAALPSNIAVEGIKRLVQGLRTIVTVSENCHKSLNPT
jgi:aspartate/methionine/tyrosine aminotransferase